MDERPEGVPAQAEPQQPQTQPQPQSQPSPPGPAPARAQQHAFGPAPAPASAQWYPPTQPAGAYPPLTPPPPSGGTGRAGRAALWATVGAVVASALWAGGVFVLGRDDGPQPDLRGYESKANLCSSMDYSSIESEYPVDDDNPIHRSLAHDALDQSYCSLSLQKYSSSYSYVYLSVEVNLHKETDPAPEFTALWSEYKQRFDDYDVEKLSGFGDEAYLVTSEPNDSQYATLAVRDGWMTYEMSWSIYLSSTDDDEDKPDLSDVEQWLKTDTKATLEKLKSD